MAWTVTSDVSIGAYTKASDHNKVRANADYLQVLATVGHDFDVSTGTGLHRALWSAPIVYKVGAAVFFAEWIDDTNSANGEYIRRMKFGTTAVNCKPASITDCTYGVQLFQPLASQPV